MTEAGAGGADRPLAPRDVIGFVGLGNMGAPMVARLLGAGFAVRGYDASPDAGREITTDGAQAAYTRVDSLADVAAGARAVILMLPNSTIVEQVLVTDGLLEAMQAGAVLIDMGSSRPEETQRMAKEAERRGVRFVDAPVSGGVPAARDGSLTIMAGGPQELVEECRPALEPIGTKVVHCGPVGAGHAMKAINNLLSASTLLASSEALLIGSKFGLDETVMMDAINGSSGRSWSTMAKWPRNIIPRTFNSGFLMGLMVKDTRIALDLAESTGVAASHSRATLEMWEKALEELPEGADHTDIFRWVEQRS
jgi:3-hydroxyisobutyrate dehydrogenase